MQFHILSFEGPDGYARAGGIASRVIGLSSSLAAQGYESHLWFVGDPGEPGHAVVGDVHLHRWCRDLARAHPIGVALQDRLRDRVVLTKIARWDRDKAWTSTLEIVDLLRQRGQRPLLVARGGLEAYGAEVLAGARARGLRVADRTLTSAAPDAVLAALNDVDEVDVVNLRSAVGAGVRSVLYAGSDVVMANSAHEPFGLVGLEAMAVGGLVCTGATGEDYAIAGHNAIVVQSASALEFVRKYERMTRDPRACRDVRDEGRATARRFDWDSVIERNLLPQVDVTLGR